MWKQKYDKVSPLTVSNNSELNSYKGILQAHTHTSRYLMSKTSTAAVNHYTDLSHLFNAHLSCTELAVDLINNLYLSIVITSTKSTELSHLPNKSHNIGAFSENADSILELFIFTH